MQLTDCQANASELFEDFLESEATVFGLFGFAGTGKSFMLARFIKEYIVGSPALLASPTHKAAHVMRRFLTAADVPYSGFDPNSPVPIVGTTAQLLGIRPTIGEEQDSHDLKFAKVAKGYMEQMLDLGWVVIDEVSMLSSDQFKMVVRLARERGARVLVVGDPGQLPPVNAGRIDFKTFRYRAVLKEVCRTADETGITALATAIRKDEDWKRIRGSAIERVRDAAGTYISEISEPFSTDEMDWSVYVAYRNAAVDSVNEAVCQKLYGHSRSDIADGEIVLAGNTLQGPYIKGLGKTPLCTNGETLIVERVGRRGRWGVNIDVRSLQTGMVFIAEYLPENELRDRNHPYNVKLTELRAKAEHLQKEFRETGENDALRRQAWGEYFSLRDDTVLSLVHPFAMTSHKSQGSTYRRAFVDATDMAAFDRRALYVGVTRPSEELVIG